MPDSVPHPAYLEPEALAKMGSKTGTWRYMRPVIREWTAPCRAACPAGVNAQRYVACISEGKFKDALEVVRETMPFVGVCGRICARPCEKACERGKFDEPISIRTLKRFIAEYELKAGREKATPIRKTKKDKVAIIGSGLAGLACAYDLIRQGYPVTVFEAAPESGGFLRTIPENRLPKKVVDDEISYIQELGVEIKTNTPVKDLSTIFNQSYRAIFIATARRSPVPVKGSGLNKGVRKELQYTDKGTIPVDPVTLQTDIEGVFAGGDVVSGPSGAIDSIAAGKEAAISIDRYLKGIDLKVGRPALVERGEQGENAAQHGKVNTAYFQHEPRQEANKPSPAGINGSTGVDPGLDETQAVKEAGRCFHCGTCNLCGNCWFFCPETAMYEKDGHFQADLEYCKGCGICAAECPCGVIIMEEEPR